MSGIALELRKIARELTRLSALQDRSTAPLHLDLAQACITLARFEERTGGMRGWFRSPSPAAKTDCH
jgi:hypothetical protein